MASKQWSQGKGLTGLNSHQVAEATSTMESFKSQSIGNIFRIFRTKEKNASMLSGLKIGGGK